MLRKWILGPTWTVLRLFGAALIKEGFRTRMTTSMLKLEAMFNTLVTIMVLTVTHRVEVYSQTGMAFVPVVRMRKCDVKYDAIMKVIFTS